MNALANKFLDAITLSEAQEEGASDEAVGKPLPKQEPQIIEQSDAQQAYTQSPLAGTETWVYLPPHRWPKHSQGQNPSAETKRLLKPHR